MIINGKTPEGSSSKAYRHSKAPKKNKQKKKTDKTQNKNMTRKIIITNLVLFSINNRHVGKKRIKACKHTINQYKTKLFRFTFTFIINGRTMEVVARSTDTARHQKQ